MRRQKNISGKTAAGDAAITVFDFGGCYEIAS